MSDGFTPRSYEEILQEMTENYEAQCGYSPNEVSDLSIRLGLLSDQIAFLHEKLDFAGKMLFADTATGVYLDRHAQTRGLLRKGAVKASGKLQFQRDTAASYDISIPVGTICCTDGEDPIRFETTKEAALSKGTTQVEVEASAMEGGRLGNVAKGAVSVMVTPPQGIARVTNITPFSGGNDQEDDEALRTRLLAAYASIANGTNAAYYYNLAMSFDFVRSAHVIPRRRGRGTVDVIVDVDSTDNGRIAEIAKAIGEQREIGVDAQVSRASEKSVSVTLSLTVDHGFVASEVKEQVETALQQMAQRQGVAQPFQLAKMYSYIINIQGVYNFKVATPTADVMAEETQVLRPSFTVTAQEREEDA